MKKLTGIVMIATIAFSSCNTSKYYFKMRTGSISERTIENDVNEPKEINTISEITKDTSVISANESPRESVPEGNYESDIDSLKKNDHFKFNRENIHVATVSEETVSSREEKRTLRKEKRKESRRDSRISDWFHNVNWEEVIWDTVNVLITLGCIGLSCASWAEFFALIALAAIGALVFGFILWLLFHNFIDGLRDYRSRR